MTANKRDSNRLGLVIDIQLTNGDNKVVLKSRNISDTGVFLECQDNFSPLPIGSQVILQVCSMMNDDPPPPVKAEVVRLTEEGMGLSFIL